MNIHPLIAEAWAAHQSDVKAWCEEFYARASYELDIAEFVNGVVTAALSVSDYRWGTVRVLEVGYYNPDYVFGLSGPGLASSEITWVSKLASGSCSGCDSYLAAIDAWNGSPAALSAVALQILQQLRPLLTIEGEL